MNAHSIRPALRRAARWLWPALLAAQIALLCWLTFRSGITSLDCDAAKVFTHVRAMWEQGTLLPADWQYITTLELDCASLPALAFYAVTGNLLLSFQLADLVLIAAWVAVVFGIFARLRLARRYACLGALLVLLPYAFGQLSYWNMMFLNAAQYGLKTLLPLLFVYLLLPPARGRRTGWDWAVAVLYLLLVLCTGFSSGVYVAMCGLAPVLAAMCWSWLNRRLAPDRCQWFCAGGTVLLSGVGVWLNAALGIAAKGNSILLNTIDTIHRNTLNCLLGLLQLFFAVPYEDTHALSRLGVDALLRTGFVLGLGAVAVLALCDRFRARRTPAGSGYLAAIFWWNLAVLLFTNTVYYAAYFEFRYHLIGILPVLLLVAVWAPQLENLNPDRLRAAAKAGGAGVLCLLFLLCNLDAHRDLKAAAGVPGVNTEQRALVGALDTLSVQDVFMLNASEAAEICAALDPTRRYITYDTGTGAALIYDGPLENTEALSYTTPAALVVSSGTDLSTLLPAYLSGGATCAMTVAGYDVYLTPAPPKADGAVGLAFGTAGWDYCDSPGYTCTGTMDADRRLHTGGAGGCVLTSAGLTLAAPTDITLEYALPAGADAGTLEAWSEGELLASTPVEPGQTAALLPGVSAQTPVVLLVRLTDGTDAVLNGFRFAAAAQ